MSWSPLAKPWAGGALMEERRTCPVPGTRLVVQRHDPLPDEIRVPAPARHGRQIRDTPCLTCRRAVIGVKVVVS